MTIQVLLITVGMGDVVLGYYQSLIGSQVNDAGIITLSRGSGSGTINLSGNWHGYWVSNADIGEFGPIEGTLNQMGASISGSLSGYTSSCGAIQSVFTSGTVFGRTAFFSSTFLCTPMSQNFTIHLLVGSDSANKMMPGTYILVQGSTAVDFGIVTSVRGLSSTTGSFSGAFDGTWSSIKTLGFSGTATGWMSQGGNSLTGSLDIHGSDCGDIYGVTLAGTVTGSRSSSYGDYYCPPANQNISFDLLLSLTDSGDIVTGIYQNKLGLTTLEVGIVEGRMTAGQSVSADFSANPLTGVAPLSVQFTDLSNGVILNRTWSFGDGGTSIFQSPNHVYQWPGTYSVSLTVSGPGGSDSEIKTAYINVTSPPQPPIAGFSGTPTTGFAPLSVSFKDESIGSVSNWAWDFGGGSPGFSSIENPTNTYSTPGNYSVTLTVVGPGGISSLSKGSYIVVKDPTPLANFNAHPLSGTSPLQVQFSDLSTGNIADHLWSFGDGETSNTINPLHTYTFPGVYSVALTVSGSVSNSTETKTNYINVNHPPPVAKFSMEPSRGEAPLNVQFNDLSTGVIESRTWELGDGSMVGNHYNPLHTYNDIGVYTAKLKVIGPGGTCTSSGTVYVYDVSYVDQNDRSCNGNSPCHYAISGAAQEASAVAMIKVTAGNYREDLGLTEQKVVLLEGGYDSSFLSRIGATGLRRLYMPSGTIIPDRINLMDFTYYPVEAVHKQAYFNYLTPPVGFTAAVGWMQAIDIDGKGNPCKVEVDWMRLHAVVNGADNLILEDTFNSRTGDMAYYGLYSRNPWFDSDNEHPMPFDVANSTLIMEPNLHPDRVYHWWNTARTIVPQGATRIWFEARVRITGGAGVQAGIDYWKDLAAQWAGLDINNTEAGASDWFGNVTTDWQVISVGKP